MSLLQSALLPIILHTAIGVFALVRAQSVARGRPLLRIAGGLLLLGAACRAAFQVWIATAFTASIEAAPPETSAETDQVIALSASATMVVSLTSAVLLAAAVALLFAALLLNRSPHPH